MCPTNREGCTGRRASARIVFCYSGPQGFPLLQKTQAPKGPSLGEIDLWTNLPHRLILHCVAHPVFISYARATSRDDAEALHQAFGGAEGQAFLDRTDLEAGEAIPPGLVDALFSAKIVVVFGEPRYFSRWYCLREFHATLAAFNALVERGASEEARS